MGGYVPVSKKGYVHNYQVPKTILIILLMVRNERQDEACQWIHDGLPIIIGVYSKACSGGSMVLCILQNRRDRVCGSSRSSWLRWLFGNRYTSEQGEIGCAVDIPKPSAIVGH